MKTINLLLALTLVSAASWAESGTQAVAEPATGERAPIIETPLGEAVERHSEMDGAGTPWVQDKEKNNENRGDRFEKKEVLEKKVKTVKLRNVVPPIHFGSGEADIPKNYVDLLRDVLARVKSYTNVRLHFVGYSDNVPVRGAAKEKYGDNEGLSRERAGVAAEFFKDALNLPPEAVSYDGMGERNPIASNATAAGKAKNRRVEVEVWYDETEEKLVQKDVLVTEQLNRVKVCRVETVCKLSYKEGRSKRARIRNLVPPLRSDNETGVPAEFAHKVLQAMSDLKDKRNVVVKLIAFTDSAPLEGRDARIYGSHLALSKARARRAALALQEALKLPSSSVDSEGRGDAMPVASNDTDSGRALNRRIEAEFWYDDPFQQVSDEPQLCPESAGAETVTRVYEPTSGRIPPIYFDRGKPVVSEEYLSRLRQVLDEVKDKTNTRLRFIGYTENKRLDRRMAMVYGDDIGLSTARARRAMEAVKAGMGLSDAQVEHEGHGYLQSDDVVNVGFTEADVSRVEVQVVYDDLAALDDSDAMEIARITREVSPSDPFTLNLMRITVDGIPVHDAGKSTPDVERCTDQALEKAKIQFKFDNLEMKPRLNVTAWPLAARYQDDAATELPENLVRFRIYTNYPSVIKRSEIRLFGKDRSTRDEPLAVAEVGSDGTAEWQAKFDTYAAPGRELKYLLRVYDAEGHFDETATQSLWIVDKLPKEAVSSSVDRELLAGYGENRLALQNIPLSGGTIRVYGSGIPPDHTVWLAGDPVPVSKEGEFVAEKILPRGMHTVEVAVLDSSGNGELFLRDLELKKNDWFYVGIADLTASASDTNGPADLVTNDKAHYDNDFSLDGRLAGYVKGRFGDDWQLTASADTLEGPVEDLFTNFMDKSPDALFRRIDPDYYYPTYGDDGTVEEGAPTMGKFYLKLERGKDYGLWGNFKIGYAENSLAQVDRGLYGANVHIQSDDTTTFGEERLVVDGFAAQPGTVAGRDEFRGTGGSLYYLRHQDILSGSERTRIEIRDKDSGLVVGVKNLTPGLDYTVDYLQGRIMLAEPLAATADDSLLVDSGAGAGNEAYLVVRYEFTPGFDDMNNLSNGGQLHYWFGDHVRLGLTANENREAGETSTLNGADLIVRKSAETWVKVETGKSEGAGVNTLGSIDGGFSFGGTDSLATPDDNGEAYRIEGRVGLEDLYEGGRGSATAYRQVTEAGYSAPGLSVLKDTVQYGGTVAMPVTDKVGVKIKADRKKQKAGLETSTGEVDVDYLFDENWTLSGGARNEYRNDRSTIVPLTQIEGERTDMVARATYDSKGPWLAYGFVQDTVNSTGNQESNGRVGTGGEYRIGDRFKLLGEASTGDLGEAGKVGLDYLYSDRTNIYTNYALENERTDNGVRARKGSLISGFRSRYSDSTSVYLEERYAHGDVPTGLTHAAGVDLAPNDRWNFGLSADYGTLRDNQTGAETERTALGLRVGYGFEAVKIASALEYRIDRTQNSDLTESERTTWLTKNSLKYQISPDWRFIGKLEHSRSESSQGNFYDGRYTEVVAGYGYRPVSNDRLNALMKYTYFYNLPSADQVTLANTATAFVQKSHIFSIDTIYDLNSRLSIGGKYAYRLGQVSQDRENLQFFDSRAHLYIARLDWHFVHQWDALVEGRMLSLPDAKDSRSGALVAVYRHINENVRLGAGYNFTTFSDDLTDLSYDNQGVFINIVGTI